MKILRTVKDMRAFSLRRRLEGRGIGFVPTMGYLHEGHISLVNRARSASDIVVVSIFVNPTQFGPGEDFGKYPRDIKRDAGMCRNAGVDVVFAPTVGEMYASDRSVKVIETSLSAGLCGASRPGHFDGVATVVAKLFNIVLPDVAVFGGKDAQQARIVERMTRDLNFPVEVIVAPTVREPDGLAMSSRNKYLSPVDRERASGIYGALRQARELFDDGARDGRKLKAFVERRIAGIEGARIDYVDLVDMDGLKPMAVVSAPALLAVAVRIGGTRLIDNVVLKPAGRRRND